MNGTVWIRAGAIFGAIAVLAGTVGAHVLEGKVDPERLGTFEIAVRYQMFHALALIGVGLLSFWNGSSTGLSVSGWFFLIGSILFPGSLYALVLAGGTADWLGGVTPFGGLSMAAGWLTLAFFTRLQPTQKDRTISPSEKMPSSSEMKETEHVT